ncbi:MAG: D-ala D-ala ligase family protein [Mucilaginibacter sp.]|nr:D-ala D-ala ligase family protein [Mucilaginibacter sp.]
MQLTDFSTLVLIADNVVFDKKKVTLYSQEVDRAYNTNVSYLKAGFEQLFQTVIVYDDPQSFLANAKSHKNDIIFPYWHGESSRNKHAVISSICEIENLIYIGPDTYANIVCSDKILSKDICRMANVKYPRFKVINEIESNVKWPYRYPVVVKPVYEGSSLGMTQENIINDIIGIQKMARKLLAEFKQPILVEEFIGGIEVNMAIIGWKDTIKVWSAAERYHTLKPGFFNSNLFAFEEKNLNDDIVLRDGRHLISEDLLKRITHLFSWLDKIEHIRIDGKILDGEFYCIELTQDADLHPEGSFFTQLQYAGYDFIEALRLLVDNCLERYNNQFPIQS